MQFESHFSYEKISFRDCAIQNSIWRNPKVNLTFELYNLKVFLLSDLELSSMVYVAINTIFYSFRSIDFVYHSAVNIKILSYRSIVIWKLENYNNRNNNPNCHLYIWFTCKFLKVLFNFWLYNSEITFFMKKINFTMCK